jgi:flagella basal body P-ring formation protein FlgA
MKPLSTLLSTALCLSMMPLCAWAADAASSTAAQDAMSQVERERIVKALVEGDDKTGASFNDVDLPKTTTPVPMPVMNNPYKGDMPAVAPQDSSKTNNFEIKRRDAENAISIALAQQGAAELVEASIVRPVNTVLYKHSSPLKIDIKTLQFDAAAHTWSANLLLTNDAGEVITALPTSGRWLEMQAVPSVKRNIRAGEVITEDDIELMNYPKARLHDDNVMDMAELVGTTPRRTISNNRPIRKNEVQAPAVVKKGANVTMRFNTPAMSISTIGQALQAGGKGEMIRVKNMDSNAIVQATVLSESEVLVGVSDGTNSNAQAVIIAPPKPDVTVQAGKEVATPLTPLPNATPAQPAPLPTPSQPQAQIAPTQEKIAEPAPQAVATQPTPNAALQSPIPTQAPAQAAQPIPIRPEMPHTEQAKQAATEEDKKAALKEKMVRDAFMESEGMTPSKALEELNPDDMILAPRKMILSPDLPDLDPTKPRSTNPLQGMTP